jgi:hypothetical protein
MAQSPSRIRPMVCTPMSNSCQKGHPASASSSARHIFHAGWPPYQSGSLRWLDRDRYCLADHGRDRVAYFDLGQHRDSLGIGDLNRVNTTT